MLYSPQFFSVPRPEGSPHVVEQYFQFNGDPCLTVGELMYSPTLQHGVFADFNAFCDTVCHAVNVLTRVTNKAHPSLWTQSNPAVLHQPPESTHSQSL